MCSVKLNSNLIGIYVKKKKLIIYLKLEWLLLILIYFLVGLYFRFINFIREIL